MASLQKNIESTSLKDNFIPVKFITSFGGNRAIK